MFMLQEKKPIKLSQSALLSAAISVLLLQGCATSATGDKIEKGLEASENIANADQNAAKSTEDKEAANDSEANEKDPYEGFNRAMFSFNDKVDSYVAEPITTAYKWITPNFVQTGISNFFNNTKTVNVVLNDVLQGKMTQSAQDTGRFLVNTTVGVGGLFDVAKHIGLEQHDEDFDQTLAVWGVPKGAYLVLPIVGPSTTRGIPGSVVDTAANPVTYVGMPVQVLSMLNARANAEGALKFIDEAALDPYVFTRESFLQWRDFMSSDGKSKAAASADDFEDELDENLGEDEADSAKPAADGKSAAPNTGAAANTQAKEVSGSSVSAQSSAAAVTQSTANPPAPTAVKSYTLQTQVDSKTPSVSDNALKQNEPSLSKPW